ncbi:uncharacterized protein LOC111998774 [Quercus suber]|uniref:uncharacterized protein LOC111998774 n=1 Tax=Quercus suber TaxID=58331 RepID=UPI000CE1D504|nr:uncharacterized protein LOC111998774 [Quercus suber]
MVSSLINQETKWWKASVVRALFLPFEADTILKIPLSQNLPEETLIWIGNKRGVFTVKSAYFIAAKLQAGKDMGESSSGDLNALIWKNLWKLKLPAKVKIFSWRACVNGLPVYAKMVERGIHLGWDCPVCGDEPENLIHALISCDFAISVWSLWQDCPLSLLLNATDLTDVVHKLCLSHNAVYLEYFFAISWAIWHNRNLLAHNEKGLSPLQVWNLAESIIDDFHEANSVLCPAMQATCDGWMAPPPGFFKVIVDGASPLDGHRVLGVGAIVRDDKGNVVAALSKALPSHYPAEWTEFFALEQGVLLAQNLAIPNVIFESNAAFVIQAVLHDHCGNEIGHLIQGIQSAKSSFSSCSFRHVKRVYNRVAHGLAQFAKWNNTSYVWKDVYPLFLQHLIQLDLG